jgi:UDP-N-acetyl-D-mannosaminuronate dehydrogenase
MRKVCKKNGAETFIDDPYVSDRYIGYQKMFDVKEYDAVIVMTPHDTFLKTYPVKSFNDQCVIVDIWKLFEESSMSKSGIYKVGDII